MTMNKFEMRSKISFFKREKLRSFFFSTCIVNYTAKS